MSETLFTSDLHFYHEHICSYNPRPWTNAENTERLIDIWNSQVRPGDTVYHHGDFSFLKAREVDRLEHLVEALNGNKVFILGNHDQIELWSELRKRNLSRVRSITDSKWVKVNGKDIAMSHYPWEVWRNSHHGSWHLHGHCHGTMPQRGKRLDVGIDNHPQHKLFTFEEIKAYMDAQEIWAPDGHKVRIKETV